MRSVRYALPVLLALLSAPARGATTWGNVNGEFYTGTHTVATFSDPTATIEYLELTYTDDATIIGGGNRNYDALGLLHTSPTVNRDPDVTGKIGAWRIGRYTGFPDVMTFCARYDWGTSLFECSTLGSGASGDCSRTAAGERDTFGTSH